MVARIKLEEIKMIETYYKVSNKKFKGENLILETTRLYISKKSDLSKLIQLESNLHYDGNLLLENISLYKFSKINDITTINICIYDNEICQEWKIKD